ncbi:EAL domain-containing protein [Sphingomonas sanguinis]|uniref:putative bifunctional diguanylate cyclase/phosphodiesterase n=1 Tax=Sphingomonas sanguinis TaxID=33051 RepID=UPI001C56057C|nr:EAL domain-containing protein [Sphingomonas sanguinis]QXT35413.1 EAL domain-containing protein [Sphingomonas sanguinis]
MQTAIALSEIASSFDHEDGNLYRLMVDEAANGHKRDSVARLAHIQSRIAAISIALSRQQTRLPPAERARARRIVLELHKYGEAVNVVSSMLEIDFATSVGMLRPFRANADHVLNEMKGIATSGIADANRHAEAATLRTRLLAALVTVAVLIVAALSYLWLALAAKRGQQLHAEIMRRGEAEREALQLAQTDALTGIMNRRVFNDELRSAMDAARAVGSALTIVLVDLDGFKEINDTYGHAAGDTVLRTVAQRLRIVFGPASIVARLGGDEFAVLLLDAQDGCDPLELPQRASQVLRQTLTWRDNAITIGASIGVSVFPQNGTHPDELLHAADIAMYEAKRNRTGGACLFLPRMEEERVAQRLLEEELRIGIQRGEIKPFYQPIIDFSDGALCGFEVLARWQHPKRGLLTPGAFIRVAETTGQITELTKAILRQACRDALLMPDHLRLAVNISPTQLEEPRLAETLIDIIHQEGVSPTRIEIEITEDAVMDDVVTAERVMQTFRSAGLSIALDDFGTGYSSLSNLRRLRFDKIKIDQSFVQSLPTSIESEKLVDAIIGLAFSFGMKITAEGVEDPVAAEILARKGCTQGQGWLYGMPTPLEQTLTILPRWHAQNACR